MTYGILDAGDHYGILVLRKDGVFEAIGMVNNKAIAESIVEALNAQAASKKDKK